MIASGEAPVRLPKPGFCCRQQHGNSSFIMHSCPHFKGHDTVFDGCSYQFCAISFFPHYPLANWSRLREARQFEALSAIARAMAAAEWSRQFEASDKMHNYGHGSKRHFCLPESRFPSRERPFALRNPAARNGILDAETGGQKPALETADVHRDRKSK